MPTLLASMRMSPLLPDAFSCSPWIPLATAPCVVMVPRWYRARRCRCLRCLHDWRRRPEISWGHGLLKSAYGHKCDESVQVVNYRCVRARVRSGVVIVAVQQGDARRQHHPALRPPTGGSQAPGRRVAAWILPRCSTRRPTGSAWRLRPKAAAPRRQRCGQARLRVLHTPMRAH